MCTLSPGRTADLCGGVNPIFVVDDTTIVLTTLLSCIRLVIDSMLLSVSSILHLVEEDAIVHKVADALRPTGGKTRSATPPHSYDSFRRTTVYTNTRRRASLDLPTLQLHAPLVTMGAGSPLYGMTTTTEAPVSLPRES